MNQTGLTPSGRYRQTKAKSKPPEMVSRVSRWEDSIWRFDNDTPGQPRNVISWDFRLADGSRSTETPNEVLLESFREVCWGMLVDGGWYGRTLKTGSAGRMGVGAKELFLWMSHQGLSDFSKLTRATLNAYLSDMPTLLLNRERFYGSVDLEEDAGSGDEDEDGNIYSDEDEGRGFGALDSQKSVEGDQEEAEDDPVTYARVCTRIQFIYFIFAQRARVKERGFPCFKFIPFDGKRQRDVIAELAKDVKRHIPPLPDEVAIPLLTAALAWIDEYSSDIMSLQSTYFEARTSALKRGLSRSRAQTLASDSIKDFTFRDVRNEGTPWREKLEPFNLFCQGGTYVWCSRVEAIRYFISRLCSAAILILQYAVGLRVNEICGLSGGWNEQEGLPNCVTRKYSRSGLLEMFFVQGVVSKGRTTPEADEWLVGCRPAGAMYLPPPVRALCLLERLFAPWRELGKRLELIVTLSTRRGVAWQPASIGRFTASSLHRGLKLFVFSEVDLSGLPERSRRDEDLTQYSRSKGMCIVPTQGRKTFAAYILEARSLALPALRQHFKHYHEATTESAYFPTEIRLRADIEAVIASETINFFVSVIQGKKLQGRMAEAIANYFHGKKFDKGLKFGELKRQVAEVVETHDLRIFFADHGNCFIQVNPLNSRCRAVSKTASWSSTTPDFKVRTPGMCAGCACFAIDAAHVSFWQQRYEQYSSTVALASKVGHAQEYAVHQARADQAKKILQMLHASFVD